MSLDKAIEYGKEHRRPYRGGKSFDKDCRNHGACEICLSAGPTIPLIHREELPC